MSERPLLLTHDALATLVDELAAAGAARETEYRPVVAMLREAGLVGDRTDAEAYMRIAGERYWLLRTHEWSDEVLQQVVEGKGRWRHPEG